MSGSSPEEVYEVALGERLDVIKTLFLLTSNLVGKTPVLGMFQVKLTDPAVAKPADKTGTPGVVEALAC